jgi:ABC-type dipeptide/oligopeptide/nickel transport system ATPase component
VPEAVLKIAGLRTSRVGKSGTTDLLTDVNVEVRRGEIVGIVGESGVGKSLLMASVLNLLDPPVQVTGGEVMFGSRDLAKLPEEELGRLRGKEISFIGPNPHTLLNPLLPVGQQVVNFVRTHERLSKDEARERVLEMFKAVGIPDAKRRLDTFPHELSGGMAQRVVISIGLICSPQVILADEPTFGLDVTIQAQVLELIRKLVGSRDDRAMLIATRDLSIIANYADTVHVLHDGTVVESAAVLDFFRGPTSEQGRRLLQAAELRRELTDDEGVETRAPA